MKSFFNYIFFILTILIIVYFGNSSFASTGSISSTSIIPVNEEKNCFNILTENVRNQYNIDLSSVVESQRTGNIIDLSTYDKFLSKTFPNHNQKYNIGLGNFFSAKRNNIGTILFKGDTILSQFTGFGNRTNFSFPLKSQNNQYITGDKYPDFRQNIIYTHHLLDGTFVSCGFLKVRPKGTHNLFSISQKDYYTNIYLGSGFEILDSSKNIGQNEFLVGKVTVVAEDYGNFPLFDIDLITVAYNNKSSYFNEFETFPKQVKAMTNIDNQADGLWKVMDDFKQRVINNTCLEAVRSSGATYPSKCNGGSKSLSYDSYNSNLFSFIPRAYARIQAVKDYKNIMEKSRGMMVFDGLPYELYNKLLSIKDSNFRNSLLLAIIPEYKKTLKYKMDFGKKLSSYENIFYNCNMSYTDRINNVIDILKNINDVNKIDYNNLSYLDENFGNCVIPYSDKKNLGKVIKNTFSSVIMKKDNTLESTLEKEFDLLIKKQQLLDTEYNSGKADIQKRLEKGELLGDSELNEIKVSDTKYEKQSKEISKKLDILIKGGIVEKKSSSKNIIKNTNNKKPIIRDNIGTSDNFSKIKFYSIILLTLFIGGFLIFLGIKRKS